MYNSKKKLDIILSSVHVNIRKNLVEINSQSWLQKECSWQSFISLTRLFLLDENISSVFCWKQPSTHTTLFWHPCDVVLTLWTLHGHRNDVVCLRGGKNKSKIYWEVGFSIFLSLVMLSMLKKRKKIGKYNTGSAYHL